MGNVSVNIIKSNVEGAEKEVIADVTFSGTYAAGGDSYTDAQFGLPFISQIDAGVARGSATTGYLVDPDLQNRKLKLLASAAAGTPLTETATGNQSGTVARVVARGGNPY